MYTVVMGGISFGYFANGIFQTDGEMPFINQVTTIRIDPQGLFTQYLMDAEYPLIPSTGSNPGNPLPVRSGRGVLSVHLRCPCSTTASCSSSGWGRRPSSSATSPAASQSTVPNTAQRSDSAASPYIFKVTLIPR